MAVHYVKSSGGSESNGGTSDSDAWLYPPGMTGSTHAGDVSFGDEVAIANGSSYTGRRLIPIEGVSYYGYGLGGAQITIKKVVKGCAALAYDYEVARERGVHQGSWELNAGSLGSAYVLRYDNDDASVADVTIYGDVYGTDRDTVLLGDSRTVINATLRRACVVNSAKIGVKAFALNPVIEEVQVLSASQDCMMISTESAGDYGIGGHLQINDIDLRNPNMDENGVYHTATGDLLQMLAVDGEWKRSAVVDGFYGVKLDSPKQAANIHDCYGGYVLRNFHWVGDANSSMTIDGGSIRGRLLIEDGYLYEGSGNFHFLRLNPQSGTNLTQILAATGHITLRRIVVNCPAGDFSGLLTLASANTPSGALDGTVIVESCVCVGAQAGQAIVKLWTASMQPTVGTLKAIVRNNAFFMSGSQSHIDMPSGKAGNANYKISNNFFPSSSSFKIGSTTYSSVAAFEAAHSYATANDDAHTWEAMQFDEDSFKLGNGSPLLAAGIWHRHAPALRQIV